jgi:hypothetical protein
LPRGYYFFLDKKAAKNQDGKNLQHTRPAPGPVFRQAFARFLFTLQLYFALQHL